MRCAPYCEHNSEGTLHTPPSKYKWAYLHWHHRPLHLQSTVVTFNLTAAAIAQHDEHADLFLRSGDYTLLATNGHAARVTGTVTVRLPEEAALIQASPFGAHFNA